METIKSYLEAMFANLPNTPEVHKAKSELLQMMEDKYSELIAEGKSENEAVGTVISEFGNLEELAEELNLTDEMVAAASSEDALNRRFISLEEVKDYVNAQSRHANLRGLGVFLCITAVIWPMMNEVFGGSENIGALLMFLSIFSAVAIFIYSATKMKPWSFIEKTPCQIDMNTANYIDTERKKYLGTYALYKTVGVILCAMCWLPAAFFEDVAYVKDDFGGMILFIMIGTGVFMLIKAKSTNKTYETILSLNNANTISGSYGRDRTPVYINETIASIMSVYWPTITCLYFIWSFLTFRWEITWIVWPVAAVIAKIINTTLTKRV